MKPKPVAVINSRDVEEITIPPENRGEIWNELSKYYKNGAP